MTIHLSKGLEFSIVYVVGLEENLFPSSMSSNTRSELEEERRLFYVAITRAKKQAYLTYAYTRYRWGSLIDCEPSRFLDEIDEKYLEYLAPKISPAINRFVNNDIFGDVPQNKIRFKKPVTRKPNTVNEKTITISTPSRFKKVSKVKDSSPPNNTDIIEGLLIMHTKFGRGVVEKIEGEGTNKKAEILFEKHGVKKLLLQFAKLRIVKTR